MLTPRYFTDTGALTALDSNASVSVDVAVGPFVKDALTLAFTRGFVQSQAFVRHFGDEVHIQPDKGPLVFDTTQIAGTNNDGKT